MIFLTIGTQLPFDRLVEMLDRVAPHLQEEIVGQIGVGSYRPSNFNAVDQLDPQTFNQTFKSSRVVVGHAGIGTVLSGRKFQKPLVLMPRRAAAGEHRNDHQLATAAQLRSIEGVSLFESEAELKDLLLQPSLAALSDDRPPALDKLIDSLRSEIFGGLRVHK